MWDASDIGVGQKSTDGRSWCTCTSSSSYVDCQQTLCATSMEESRLEGEPFPRVTVVVVPAGFGEEQDHGKRQVVLKVSGSSWVVARR